MCGWAIPSLMKRRGVGSLPRGAGAPLFKKSIFSNRRKIEDPLKRELAHEDGNRRVF